MGTRINHVSINALDLQESADFYYRAAERHDAFDREAFGHHLVELPGDLVQLYLRDPAGNLVEIDQQGVDRLPDDLRSQVKPLWGFNPQSDEHMTARLFVPE
jgi:catechol 2,3-dioxygenase-like lactoylglutathione lyase family enzyme